MARRYCPYATLAEREGVEWQVCKVSELDSVTAGGLFFIGGADRDGKGELDTFFFRCLWFMRWGGMEPFHPSFMVVWFRYTRMELYKPRNIPLRC